MVSSLQGLLRKSFSCGSQKNWARLCLQDNGNLLWERRAGLTIYTASAFSPSIQRHCCLYKSCVQWLSGEIGPPSGVAIFQAHRGNYLGTLLPTIREMCGANYIHSLYLPSLRTGILLLAQESCASASWRDRSTLRCCYLPGTQGGKLTKFITGNNWRHNRVTFCSGIHYEITLFFLTLHTHVINF